MIDLNHGVGDLHLVDQEGHGPKGHGAPVGHHTRDSSSRGVTLEETEQVVDTCCGTTWPTRS